MPKSDIVIESPSFADLLNTIIASQEEMREILDRIEEKLDEMGYPVAGGWDLES